MLFAFSVRHFPAAKRSRYSIRLTSGHWRRVLPASSSQSVCLSLSISLPVLFMSVCPPIFWLLASPDPIYYNSDIIERMFSATFHICSNVGRKNRIPKPNDSRGEMDFGPLTTCAICKENLLLYPLSLSPSLTLSCSLCVRLSPESKWTRTSSFLGG